MKIGFKSNLVLNLVFKFMAIGYGFYVLRWLNDYLTVSEYSEYNVITAYTGMILPVISFGIPTLIQREFTNNHDELALAKFWSSFGLFRLLSYFVGIALILLTSSFSSSNNLGLIIGIFTVQFILIVDLSFRSVCDAVGSSWQFSLTDFIAKTILCVGLLMAVRLNFVSEINTLQYFLYISGAVYCLALVLDAVLQRSHINWTVPDIQLLKKNFPAITYTTIAAITVALYLTTDKIFLKQFGFGDIEINGYTNAYKLYEVAQTVPGLTIPILSSHLKRKMDADSFTKFGTKLQDLFPKFNAMLPKKFILIEWSLIVLAIGFASMVGMWLFGGFAISLIDQQAQYAQVSLAVIPVLAMTIVPMTMTFLFGAILTLLHGERQELIASFWTMVVALVFYVFLISRFGALGAAYATLFTYVTGAIIKLLFLKKVFNRYV
jgi:O-antigen/teichoic acid export membrane protein